MQPIQRTTADVHAPSADNDAVLTYAAVADRRHCLHSVEYGYSATPTDGVLTVQDGSGTVVLNLVVAAAGPHQLRFDPAIIGRKNTAMILTLTSGGGGIGGRLNAAHSLE